MTIMILSCIIDVSKVSRVSKVMVQLWMLEVGGSQLGLCIASQSTIRKEKSLIILNRKV